MSDLALSAPPLASADWRRPLRRGGVAGGAALGVLLGWAVLAPLDSAVMAPGLVAAEGRAIHIRDGQSVRAGEFLFELDDMQARATLDTLSIQRDILSAREHRLLAERGKASDIVFPEALLARLDAAIQSATQDERANFRERAELRKVQTEVLQNRAGTFAREIEGLRSEQLASERQLELIDQELPGLQALRARGLVSVSRVSGLERERARLTAVVARAVTDGAKAQRSVGEVELQIVQGDVEFQRQLVAELIETRRLIAELDERIGVARDVLDRLVVRAPQAGVVQARRFATIGAVARPGDVLVEIAPVEQKLVIRAQLAPRDIDLIRIGQRSEIRFPNFKTAEAPVLFGAVQAFSNDRIQDPANPANSYFFVEVHADASTIPAPLRSRIRTGMAAEIIVPTGERSAASYLLEPLTDRLRQSFRER
jgi:HlyD family type I secretion membrane fusion protein